MSRLSDFPAKGEPPQIGFLAATDPVTGIDRGTIGALEALGVASLWAPGHVTTGRPVPEAVTGVAALAALTERVTVGTAALLLPLYHPVIIAKQFAELDRMSNGRVALAVGVGGEYPQEFTSCGVDLESRGERTDEAIEVLRALWSGRKVNHRGRFFYLEDASVDPAPQRAGGPPIVVAGRKARAMRRAALNDGWMPFLYSPRQYRESAANIRAAATALGRDLDRFAWMCFVYVSLDDDAATARQRAVRYVGAGQAGDPARFETLIDRVSATGDVEAVALRLQEFIDAGARHLVLAPCDRSGPLATATRVVEEVLPLLSSPARSGIPHPIEAGSAQ